MNVNHQSKKRSILRRGKILYLSIFVLLVSIASGALKGQQLVSSYYFAQEITSFNEITGGTVLATATAGNQMDSENYTLTFPTAPQFNFIFNGQTYTSLNINSNGYVTFGTVIPGPTLALPISSTTTYKGAISAWGRDINAAYNIGSSGNITGDISYEVQGTAPNRELVIQWRNFNPSKNTSTTAAYVFSFQIRLAETTNVIKIVYNQGFDPFGGTSAAYTGNIQNGLRGETNADFKTRLTTSTTKFSNSVAGTANNSSLFWNTLTSPPGMPDTGLTFVYTPATCFSPTAINISNVTTTTADVNFTAPTQVPSIGYEVYYSTSNVTPLKDVTLDASNSVTGTSSPIIVNGLQPATQYYVWVRSRCSATDVSEWAPVGISFVTLCNAFLTPYSQNFDTTSTGSSSNNNAPICWKYLETPSALGYGFVQSSFPVSTPNNYYMYNGNQQTSSLLLVSAQISDLSDGTNWVKFSARGSANGATMQVGTMSDPTSIASFTQIGNTITLTNQYVTYFVEIPAGTSQYIAFKHGNAAVNQALYMDDIVVENTPSCLPPSNFVINATTASTADLSWTSSTTPANNGYTVYYSTSSTAPTNSTVLDASNSAVFSGTSGTLTSLTPLTQYFAWIKSNCSASDSSSWYQFNVNFATSCLPPAITSTQGQTVCTNGSATLSASGTGANTNWYDAATGGNLVGTGNSFSTPSLSSTTNYYVAASNVTSSEGGKITPTSTSGNTSSSDIGLQFTALNSFVLKTVDIYPYSSTTTGIGSVTVALKNSAGIVLQSATFSSVNYGPGGVLNTLPLNFNVPAGSNHRLVFTSGSGQSGYIRELTTGFTFPYEVPGLVSITSSFTGGAASLSYYYYFYRWVIEKNCESARTMVTATVDSNCLSTAEVENTKTLKVYPNPFTEFITISEVKEVSKVSVLDLSGRVLDVIENPKSQIFLGHLSSGMYMVKVDFKNGTSKTTKVIKK